MLFYAHADNTQQSTGVYYLKEKTGESQQRSTQDPCWSLGFTWFPSHLSLDTLWSWK